MDSKRFFYESEIEDPRTLQLLENSITNPSQVFDDIAIGVGNNIDQNFWKRYYGVKALREVPDYIKESNGFQQELNAVFVLLSYLLFTRKGVETLLNSINGSLKGKCTFSKTASDSSLLYRLFKYSGSYLVDDKNNQIVFRFKFDNVLRTPAFGRCLKKLLLARCTYIYDIPTKGISDEEFYTLCETIGIHNALGISIGTFQQWLNGELYGKYINETTIKNFLCIESVHLDFEKSKEIYVLGENGEGKTLLLEALMLTYLGQGIDDPGIIGEVAMAKSLFNKAKQENENLFLSGKDELMSPYGIKSGSNDFIPSKMQNIYAYGTHRGRAKSIKEAEKLGFMTLFDADDTLVDPTEWIYSICVGEKMKLADVSTGMTSQSVADKELLMESYKESSGKVEANRLALQEIINGILDKQVDIVFDKGNSYKIKYKENGALLDFAELSEGFRTTLIFVCDLLYRLSKGDTTINALESMNKECVVLIDEIDLHLHPRWQLTIVKRLRKLFPNIQFIMSTHSPHIIQGAMDDALIFRVYRKNGKTCVSEPYHRYKLNHLMINTLATSPLFNLDNARMDQKNENCDTSDGYLCSRIEQLVREDISKSAISGYLTPKKIDELILKAKEKALSNT